MIHFSGSIRRKLIVLVLLSALPALGLAVHTGIEARQEAIRQAERDALVLAASMADLQERLAAGARQFLSTLAATPEVQNLDADACTSLFGKLVEQNPDYATLLLADLAGNALAASLPSAGIRVGHRKHFQDALASLDFSPGEYLVSQTAFKPIFPFGYPVVGHDGRAKAVLMVSMDLERYGQLYDNAALPPDSMCAILDWRGTRLFYYPEKQATNPVGKPIRAEMHAFGQGSAAGVMTMAGADGVRRIYAHRQVRVRPGAAPHMYAYVGIPERVVMARADAMTLRTLGYLAAALLSAMAIAWAVGTLNIVRRVEDLVAAMHRFGSGDATARSGVGPGHGEFSQIAAAFNDMADALVEDRANRRRAEEELRRQQEMLSRTEAAAHIGSWAWDAATGAVHCSDEVYRIFRLDPAGPQPSAWQESLYRPESHARLKAAAEATLAGDGPFELELEIVRADGTTGHCLGRGCAKTGPDGAVTRLFGSVQDITGRKLAEQALRDSEDKFRTVFETAADAIYVNDLQGRFLDVNRQACARLGYAQEELLRMTPADIDGPEFADRVPERIERLNRDGALTFESSHVRKDGSRIPVEINTKRIRYGGQEVMLSVVRDLTERKRAEAALRESEERYRILAEQTPVSIMGFDRDGRVTFVNEWHLRTFGRAEAVAEDFLGRHVRELPGLVSSGLAGQVLRVVAGEPVVVDQAFVPMFSGGRSGWISLRGVPLRRDGAPAGAIVIREDISRSKALEADLRAAKEAAEAASLAKSTFLATMSHEIRTPMNGIMGMLQLLRTSPMAPDLAQYVELALHASRNLLRILSDILDLSRIEAGAMSLQDESFGLDDLVRSVAGALEAEARHKGLGFLVAVDPSLPAFLRGDPGRIRQVLFNLLGNAIKYTERGEVRLEVYGLPHRRASGQVCLHLAVADTGIGIPDGQLARVFEPFIQADGSHARKYGGTGLGLSIVKRLVSLMDGTLAISTKEGQGSEIHVSLWLSPVEAPAPEEADRPGPWTPPRRGRVLVVEDEPINRMAITRMLEMLGYVVSQAANGQEAIELLGRTAHDVVLMDVQMPVMDGIEATRRLRSGEAGGADPTVPVIALTAYAMAGDREMLLAAGADAYLSKPVDHELLVRELARLEQRRSSFSRP